MPSHHDDSHSAQGRRYITWFRWLIRAYSAVAGALHQEDGRGEPASALEYTPVSVIVNAHSPGCESFQHNTLETVICLAVPAMTATVVGIGEQESDFYFQACIG